MRPPDRHNLAGKAWNVTPDKHPFTLASWFLLAPGAHPMWDWYFVNLVHLRDGVPHEEEGPPKLHYPEAEYELLIVALDPDTTPPNVDDPLTEGSGFGGAKMLTPINLVKQFHGITDAEAVDVASALVQAFVEGLLNPDSDGNSRTLDSIDKTVAHFQGECCGQPDATMN